MTMLLRGIGRLAFDRRGVSALEYGLIACAMGGFLIAGFTAVWAPLSPSFTIIGDFIVSTAASGF
jgi:Flp pilus assembly pilin Flp